MSYTSQPDKSSFPNAGYLRFVGLYGAEFFLAGKASKAVSALWGFPQFHFLISVLDHFWWLNVDVGQNGRPRGPQMLV